MEKPERGMNDLILKGWELIDLATEKTNDSNLEEKECIRWASLLGNTIDHLSRILERSGTSKLEKQDLATLLSKIPKKHRGSSQWKRLVKRLES